VTKYGLRPRAYLNIGFQDRFLTHYNGGKKKHRKGERREGFDIGATKAGDLSTTFTSPLSPGDEQYVTRGTADQRRGFAQQGCDPSSSCGVVVKPPVRLLYLEQTDHSQTQKPRV